MPGIYGANPQPQIFAYHPVHRLEAELFSASVLRAAVFLLQFLPQLRTGFAQIGLLYIENTEHLHSRIDIVFLLFILGESLIIVILDFLLRLLVYAGEGGQHYRKGFLTAQHGDPWEFLPVLARFVHPLHAVECAEAGNPVSFLFTMQHQHEGVHPVVFAPGQVAWPLQCAFRKPGLMRAYASPC